MALKGSRYEAMTDVSFFMNEAATRGGIATISTAGSGAALDQSAALVTYAAAPSGKVCVGLLLNDMVNLDQTKQHINWHKDEMQKGGKVTLLTDGWVVTNMIYPGSTPTAGAIAYLANSGYVTATKGGGGMVSSPPIGRFLSTKDEDGYAKLAVKLPQVY
jgi:hypothetical protein